MWRDKLKSLTLIEVLVAVSISVLLMGISIPMFSKNSKSQNLANEADAISAFYGRARNLAFHPDRKDVDGYGVKGENCTVGKDKCDRLVLYAAVGAVQDEVDILPMSNVTIEMARDEDDRDKVFDIVFAVGDGMANFLSTKTLKVNFKGNEDKLLININSTGSIDVVQE